MIPFIMQSLEQAPELLQNFLTEIPTERILQHRIKGKWCIHEHVCHLAEAEHMKIGRIRRFMEEDLPQFYPYIPNLTVSADHLIKTDMRKALEDYASLREKSVDMLNSMDEQTWRKKAIHSEYTDYSPYIMARHFMFQLIGNLIPRRRLQMARGVRG